MEGFLSFIYLYEPFVLGSLVVLITILSIWLLIMNFKSPEAVVLNEMGTFDEFENTLRRVIGDRGLGGGSAAPSNALEAYQKEQLETRLEKLETEVEEKDKEIVTLHKQLTQAGGSTMEGMIESDISELLEKIKDLEARLYEYEIIEDDIADLSKFKAENKKLHDEIVALKQRLSSVKVKADPEGDTIVVGAENEMTIPTEGDDDEVSKDLVAEFEKVVQNQESGEDLSSMAHPGERKKSTGNAAHLTDEKYGDVVVNPVTGNPVEPDSKEEAEVLITELKALKKMAENMSDFLKSDIGTEVAEEPAAEVAEPEAAPTEEAAAAEETPAEDAAAAEVAAAEDTPAEEVAVDALLEEAVADASEEGATSDEAASDEAGGESETEEISDQAAEDLLASFASDDDEEET